LDKKAALQAHSSATLVPILYNGPPFPTPSKLPLCMVDLDSISYAYMVPWAHSSPQPKRHLDRFSRFCRVHDRDRQTDRPTDRQTTLLCL